MADAPQIDTVTRGLAGSSRIGDFALVPDLAPEVMVGKQQELPLHTGHIAGLTQFLRDSIGTLGAHNAPGSAPCFHCEGTGRARSLWERSRSVGYDTA
ncbi:hypothetical protein AB0L10_41770 [Streptomyces flaveolus]|uniref:hypothetical protein n=1 Tax=Streptomyces flaveolus TaxID=67297 RepID=UPI003439C9E5